MSLRLLNIAKTALFAHRGALEIVGHNTANVETAGYVRQRPTLSTIPGAVSGEAGGGVELVEIRLLRDELLATHLRHESGSLGHDRALRGALLQVEQVFTDMTTGGLSSRIEEMFDAWADLGLDPTGAASRSQVVERSVLVAQTISDRWHAISNQRVEIDHRLRDLVNQANSLAREIASVNEKIGVADATSLRNDLALRRDGLVAELAELCGAETITGADGSVDVLIGGRRLVEHDRVIELSLVADPDQPGMHLVSLGGAVSPHGLRGEIAGRLRARDECLPGYLEHLDELARGLADEINIQHTAGIDLRGEAAPDFFAYDPTRPAASLRVRQEVIDDLSLIGAAESNLVDGDGTNALAIENLRNSRVFSNGTATFSQFSAELISRVGIDAAAAQTRLESRLLLVQNLRDSYENQSGVSLDEEALDLIRYQQAYAASSRLLSTALEMMDLILQLR